MATIIALILAFSLSFGILCAYAWGFWVGWKELIIPFVDQFGCTLPYIEWRYWLLCVLAIAIFKFPFYKQKNHENEDIVESLKQTGGKLFMIASLVFFSYLINWIFF